MKYHLRSIWFYSVIVFCVAIMLILVSTISQTRLTPDNAMETSKQEEQLFNQTIQQSLTDLISEKEKITKDLEDAKNKLSQYETDYNSINNDKESISRTLENSRILITSKNLYEANKYKNSKDQLKNVNVNILNDDEKAFYENLNKQLAKKGYK